MNLEKDFIFCMKSQIYLYILYVVPLKYCNYFFWIVQYCMFGLEERSCDTQKVGLWSSSVQWSCSPLTSSHLFTLSSLWSIVSAADHHRIKLTKNTWVLVRYNFLRGYLGFINTFLNFNAINRDFLCIQSNNPGYNTSTKHATYD